jgi:hypothetical protein
MQKRGWGKLVLPVAFNIYFHIFHLKWKRIQIIITIFDWYQNLIGYDISLWVDHVYL